VASVITIVITYNQLDKEIGTRRCFKIYKLGVQAQPMRLTRDRRPALEQGKSGQIANADHASARYMTPHL